MASGTVRFNAWCPALEPIGLASEPCWVVSARTVAGRATPFAHGGDLFQPSRLVLMKVDRIEALEVSPTRPRSPDVVDRVTDSFGLHAHDPTNHPLDGEARELGEARAPSDAGVVGK